jgi:hypothetical protein
MSFQSWINTTENDEIIPSSSKCNLTQAFETDFNVMHSAHIDLKFTKEQVLQQDSIIEVGFEFGEVESLEMIRYRLTHMDQCKDCRISRSDILILNSDELLQEMQKDPFNRTIKFRWKIGKMNCTFRNIRIPMDIGYAVSEWEFPDIRSNLHIKNLSVRVLK